MLRALLNLGNEHVLRPFDLKVVRRSRAPCLDGGPLFKNGRKRVAFFHPPKCGGSSVDNWLSLAFGGPAGLDPIAAEAAARNTGLAGLALREALLAYYVQRRDAPFISGHYNFSRRAFAGHEQEFEFITILRNPLDRMLSQYYFNRFREQRIHFPIDCDLSEWLSTDQARVSAMAFTRMFVGDAELVQALDMPGTWNDIRSAVSDAIANLSQFAIVGTLEHIDEFQKAAQSRYGIRSSMPHLRKNPKGRYPKFADQPTEVQDRLRELCEHDSAIYERFLTKPQPVQSFSAITRMAPG
jgi:hypothetical protein